jgi:hypothetical protein
MTASIASYFLPELGWFLGSILALMLAVTVETLFAESLLAWRQRRGFAMLALALIFGTISVFVDAPLIFRLLRGHALTTESFEQQRDVAARDIIVAREQLASAATAARALSERSKDMADKEKAAGNTCEKSALGPGARYRFRLADATSFAGIDQTVAGYSKRLDAAVAEIDALKPQVGEALRDTLQRLNASLARAYGIAHDPGLASVAQQLETRSGEDSILRRDPTGEAFHCPDDIIRGRAKSIAQQIKSLPKLEQHPQVADFTDPNTVILELPSRLAATLRAGVGSPGILGGTDVTALLGSMLLEIILFGAVWHRPGEAAVGHRILAAQNALARVPDGDLACFLNLISDPDDRVRRFFALIGRYRLRLWPVDFVVVAHGTGDLELEQLAHAVSILAAFGWAKRHRWIAKPFLAMATWWRWPEMRGAKLREFFSIDLRALDELRLAELCMRMRQRPSGPLWNAIAAPAALHEDEQRVAAE